MNNRKRNTLSPRGFESLENREMLTADPLSEWVATTQTGMIGEEVVVSVSFDNASASETGYGPYVDALIPESDGVISLVPDSVNYLGSTLGYSTVTVGDDGFADHPLAVDSSGKPVLVAGSPGDRLLVVPLPFGGFVADQPAQSLDFRVSISPDVSLDDSFTLTTNGGFRFGNTPTEDYAVDPSVIGSADELVITPSVFDTRIQYVGPESETATGASFSRSYNIAMDVADGQTVNNATARLIVPSTHTVTGIRSATGDTAPYSVATLPNGEQELLVEIGQVEGTLSDTDAYVIVDFFVPEHEADNSLVLNAETGDDALATTTVDGTATWIIDAGHEETPPTTADLQSFDSHTLSQQSIAVQEHVHAPGGVKPGAILDYRVELQVSDYFAFDNVLLRDMLADGLRFDESYVPLLTINGQSLAVSSSNYSYAEHWLQAEPQDGSHRMEVRVSDELRDRGLSGHLLGKEAGGGVPATATLSFRAIVQDEFSIDFPSGEAFLDEGDRLRSHTEVSGDVISPDSLTATGYTEADESHSALRLPFSNIATTVFAINGSTEFDAPRVAPGDTVTFRLTRGVRNGDVEDLKITGYLPMPLFSAPEAQLFVEPLPGIMPAAGEASRGPADTLHALTGVEPAYSFDSQANSVSFDFGDLSDSLNRDAVIDLLVTVTATDTPFADGLLLTEHAHASQQTTNAGGHSSNALTQVIVSQPMLSITKGIAKYGDQVGAGLDTDLTGLDAGDPVRVVITVENSGSSHNGAFDVRIQDDLPDGLVLPETGANLSVSYANGTPLSFTESEGDLFGGGIVLNDSETGAIAPRNDGSDRSVVVIAYDAIVADDVTPEITISSEARVSHYAGIEGGANRAGSDLVDPASITTDEIDVEVNLIATELQETTGTNVAIGERVTYQAVITIPEGRVENLELEGSLARGLAISEVTSIEAPGGWIPSSALSAALDATSIESIGNGVHNEGRRFRISLGDIENADRDNTAKQQIVVTYDAVATNFHSNDNGDRRWSRLDATHSTGASRDDAARVRIVEPKLQVEKQYSKSHGDAGDVITVTLRLDHTNRSEADAHDLLLTDYLADEVTLVAGSLRWTGVGVEPTALSIDEAGNLHAAWETLDRVSDSVLEYQILLSDQVSAGQSLATAAQLTWTGLIGEPGVLTPHNSQSIERTSDTSRPGGQANDYLSSDSGSLHVTTPTMTKAVAATSESHTEDANVAVGEIVTYEIIATIPEGVSAISILDTFDTSEFDLVSAEISHLGGSLTPSNVTTTFEDGNLVFNFGTLTNTPDGVVTEADQIMILVDLVVEDSEQVINGRLLTNRGSVAYGVGTVNTDASVTVVEPELRVTKQASTPRADALDTISYTITVDHAPESTSDAFGVVISDPLLDDRLRLIPESLSSDAGAVSLLPNGEIELLFGELPRGEAVTLTFDAIVEASALPGDEVTNTASSDWNGLPLSAGRTYDGSDSASVRVNSTTIGGSLFLDEDADGHRSPTELGLCEVMVYLNGTDHLGDSLTLTTTTDCLGDYQFTGLRPGEYAISTEYVDEYINGPEYVGPLGGEALEDLIAAITVSPGTDGVFEGYNFTKRPWSEITGVVFDDADNDGTRHCEEAGIAGVLITLSGVDHNGFAVQRTTITGNDGGYAFDRLAPGAYTLIEEQPQAYLEGATGSTIEVVLGESEALADTNFAELKPGILSGFTYIDLDRDGVDDANDAQLAGVSVALAGTDDRGIEVLKTTTTDANGAYSFGDLRPGVYSLSANTPEGLTDGRETIGSFDGYSDPIGRNGLIGEDEFLQIELTPGDRGYNYNFGELDDTHTPGILAEDFDRVVAFVGTGGDDTFRVEADGEAHRVVLNGEEHLVDATLNTSIRYYAGAGEDSVEMLGGQHEDRAELRFGSGKLIGTHYEFRVYSTENVMAFGGEGENRAYFYDTAGDETLVATPAEVTFTSGELTNRAEGFHRTYAYATSGIDSAQFIGSESRDTLKTAPDKARMYGDGYYNCAHGFDSIDAIAVGADDRAHLWDSEADDSLVYDDRVLAFAGAGLEVTATGFSRHDVYSTAGGSDYAELYDSASSDRFRATPVEARLDADGVRTVLHQFGSVSVVGGRGGDDRAYLHDSACRDELLMTPTATRLSGHHFDHAVSDFSRVYAYASQGAIDNAHFVDSAGDDVFKADSELARMYGDGFYNAATGFERVSASAASGNDRAYLTDSSGDDVLLYSAAKDVLFGDDYSITTTGFDRTYASSTNGGRDRTAFDRSSGPADASLVNGRVRLTGPRYLSASDFGCNFGVGNHDDATADQLWIEWAESDDDNLTLASPTVSPVTLAQSVNLQAAHALLAAADQSN